MAHTHHDHGHSAFDDDGLAEFLDLDGRVHAAHLDEIVGWVADHAPDPTGTVVDLGAGTGTGATLLARRFPDATVIAVDGSAGMVERLRDDPRLTPVHADLDAGWPEVGSPDVVWAAASLHHLADPDRVLRDAHAAMKPGALLVAVELDHQPRFLPERDELEDRLHAAMAERSPNAHPDWTATLQSAGFELVERRRFAFDADPASEVAGRYARLFLTRVRHGLAEHLAPADRDALDDLLTGLESRHDLRPRGTRTAWLARRP